VGIFNASPFSAALFGGPAGTGGQAVLVANVCYRAYRIAGILPIARRGYSPSELLDAIDALNSMLDSWGSDQLNIYAQTISTYTMVVNKQVCTIGVDPTGATVADYVGPRPQFISNANIITQIGSPQQTRVPMRILNADEWAQVRLQAVGSSIPRKIYCDYASPLANLYFYPFPNSAAQLELYIWTLFAQITSDMQPITLPPGYQRAIEYNLAVELWNMFPLQSRLDEARVMRMMREARDTKASIQAHNAPTPKMACDPAITSGRRSTFLWTTGNME
jgi:hypothetical protein